MTKNKTKKGRPTLGSDPDSDSALLCCAREILIRHQMQDLRINIYGQKPDLIYDAKLESSNETIPQRFGSSL